jgi:hypothetical protein
MKLKGGPGPRGKYQAKVNMKNLHPCFKTIDVWENINRAKGRHGKKECSSTKVLPEA